MFHLIETNIGYDICPYTLYATFHKAS